jgi:hypothetical protein
MDWYPDAGETPLIRTRIAFASGMAAPVAGLRSFRDPDRADIQGELTAWPEAPPLVVRSRKERAAGRAFEGFFRAVPALIEVAAEIGGASYNRSYNRPYNKSHDKKAVTERSDAPDPADEVEDFPVIWAAPGTAARTLPWQLDPDRAPERLRTELVVTDRRLVILGCGPDLMARAEVLWEAARDSVAAVERREFSDGEADLKLTFTDGSWTRLTTGSGENTRKLVRHLSDGLSAAESALSVGGTSTGNPPLRFVVPEGFHPLPLAATAEERARSAGEFVRELHPDGDDAPRSPAAPYFAGVAELTTGADLAYSAIGMCATEVGVAPCSFTVAAVASGLRDTEVAAQGIHATLESEPFNDVRRMDLPCGPAVACVCLQEMTVSPELTVGGEEAILHTGRIQVHVPFPTGPYTAVFTLGTTAVDQWGEVCDMMLAILRSVTFPDEPVPGSTA